MSKELVISANRHETKVALIEDDQLVEVYFQRANEYSLAGSIHKGRVTRVLPGMQSAFVDLGLERDTFLYVSDFLEEHDDIDRFSGDERLPQERPERSGQDRSGRDGRDRRGRDDRDRGDRGERRPPQTPPIPAAVPELTVEPVDAAPAEEVQATEPGATAALTAPLQTTPAAGATAPAATPGGERREERGDRRGRRSRRRRNRGRGFPDSKYASDTATPAAAGEQAVSEAEEPETEEEAPVVAAPVVADEASAQAPIVLPGESLAKYRHPAAPSAPPPPQEKRVEARPAVPAPSVAVPPPIPAPIPLTGPEAEVEDNEYDQPLHYPPDNLIPDVPAHLADPDTPERLAEIPF